MTVPINHVAAGAEGCRQTIFGMPRQRIGAMSRFGPRGFDKMGPHRIFIGRPERKRPVLASPVPGGCGRHPNPVFMSSVYYFGIVIQKGAGKNG
jgi:hypothetical protein